MLENPYYSRETQGEFELFELGDLLLESDQTLRGAKLAYRTFGTLNAEKTNAILVTTWFSGTGRVMQDVYVGAGHALDPERYFIIIVDQLGSGVSSSPQNTPAPQSMAKFPRLSIADDVTAQHRLVTGLFGIERLALVVGGSMGGQQVYEWAVTHPQMMERVAPIAATARIDKVQPAEYPLINIETQQSGAFAIQRDVNGNALGGLRLPEVVAAIGEHSGGNPAQLHGSTRLFSRDEMLRIHGDRTSFLRAWDRCVEDLVKADLMLESEAPATKGRGRAFWPET